MTALSRLLKVTREYNAARRREIETGATVLHKPSTDEIDLALDEVNRIQWYLRGHNPLGEVVYFPCEIKRE